MTEYFMDLVLTNGTKFFEFSPQKIAVSCVYCARKLSRILSDFHSSLLTEMSGVDYRSEHVLKCIETLMTLHDPNFRSKKMTPQRPQDLKTTLRLPVLQVSPGDRST
jgi:hypothetical protein